jgi:Protein of unknown function (DUF3604)
VKSIVYCLLVLFSILFLPLPAAAKDPAPSFKRTEQRAPCRDFDPLRRPLFGETHSHTTYSFDAISIGTVDRPRDAYRYAKGDAIYVVDSSGNPTICAQQPRPVDFAAITDHAEFFGELKICSTEGTPGYDSPQCKLFRKSATAVGQVWGGDLTADPPKPPEFCGPDGGNCRAQSLSLWQDIQAAAEEAYDRSPACRFTSFVAYEWTAMPDNANLHRNVIFRNAKVPKLPISNFDTGNDPRVLWRRLQAECLDAGDGCDALTIPHNGNLSEGKLYVIQENTAAYARLRSFWEPLSEIHQGKGNSECRTGTCTEDPECGFEQLKAQNLSFATTGTATTGGKFAPNAFLRNVLKDGLSQEANVGANPFKLGFVGGTDSHNATPGGTDEANFVGLHGVTSAGPEGLLGQVGFNAGALAVVWAEENSRDAIFEAMRRRETYATSGTRPIVRFFAGWDVPRDLCDQTDFVRIGYERGVPMGADLKPRSANAAGSPRFAVMAMKDPGSEGKGDAFPQVCAVHHSGAKLQRIEIVKGWIDSHGGQHEKVVTVAGGADPAAGVDPATCDPVGPGHNSLCKVWEDPDFDPAQPAFYYARVLENPTCRWSTYTCKQAGLDPFRPAECKKQLEKYSTAVPPQTPLASTASPRDLFSICCTMKPGPVVQPTEIPRVSQQRAWTSPVWYRPPGAGTP